MQTKQARRLVMAAIIGLGVMATSLSGYGASPAAAQGGGTRLPSSGQTFTGAAQANTAAGARLNPGWSPPPSPAHDTQFCNELKTISRIRIPIMRDRPGWTSDVKIIQMKMGYRGSVLLRYPMFMNQPGDA